MKITFMNFEEAVKKGFGEDGMMALGKCEEKMKEKTKALAATKEKYPDFGEEDALAIMLYTYDNKKDAEKNPYRILNKVLCKRNDKDVMKILPYTMYLLRALRKLEQHNVTKELYRGINGGHLNMDTYKEGVYLS